MHLCESHPGLKWWTKADRSASSSKCASSSSVAGSAQVPFLGELWYFSWHQYIKFVLRPTANQYSSALELPTQRWARNQKEEAASALGLPWFLKSDLNQHPDSNWDHQPTFSETLWTAAPCCKGNPAVWAPRCSWTSVVQRLPSREMKLYRNRVQTPLFPPAPSPLQLLSPGMLSTSSLDPLGIVGFC